MIYFNPFFFQNFRPMNYQNYQRNNRRNYWNNNNHQGSAPPCQASKAAEPIPCAGPCYNEADYQVNCLEELLKRYRCLKDQANVNFDSALCDLRKVSDSLSCGGAKMDEAAKLWCEIVCWLNRYYKRYGNYCECEQLLAQYDVLSQEMSCLEREALEAVCTAIHKLEESRGKNVLSIELLYTIMTQCIPKC